MFFKNNISQGEDNIKYSIGNSKEKTHGWLNGIANKFAKARGLDSEKIISSERQRETQERAQKKAMDDYLKEPTKENKKTPSQAGNL